MRTQGHGRAGGREEGRLTGTRMHTEIEIGKQKGTRKVKAKGMTGRGERNSDRQGMVRAILRAALSCNLL